MFIGVLSLSLLSGDVLHGPHSSFLHSPVDDTGLFPAVGYNNDAAVSICVQILHGYCFVLSWVNAQEGNA